MRGVLNVVEIAVATPSIVDVASNPSIAILQATICLVVDLTSKTKFDIDVTGNCGTISFVLMLLCCSTERNAAW
jgi:hypothetical protein